MPCDAHTLLSTCKVRHVSFLFLCILKTANHPHLSAHKYSACVHNQLVVM